MATSTTVYDNSPSPNHAQIEATSIPLDALTGTHHMLMMRLRGMMFSRLEKILPQKEIVQARRYGAYFTLAPLVS
jgi:hypothetical protein